MGRAATSSARRLQPTSASALGPADPLTQSVEFGADGLPLTVAPVPARARAYWQQADL